MSANTTSSNNSLAFIDGFNHYSKGRMDVLRQFKPFANKSDHELEMILRRAFVNHNESDKRFFIDEAKEIKLTGRPKTIEYKDNERKLRNSFHAVALYHFDMNHMTRQDPDFAKREEREIDRLTWTSWDHLRQESKDIYNQQLLKNIRNHRLPEKKVPTAFACYVHDVRPQMLKYPDFAAMSKCDQYFNLREDWKEVDAETRMFYKKKELRVWDRVEKKYWGLTRKFPTNGI